MRKYATLALMVALLASGCASEVGTTDPATNAPAAPSAEAGIGSASAQALDASLAPLAVDSELARAHGNGSAQRVLEVPDAARTNVYALCLGAKESAEQDLTLIQSGEELLSATCDGVPERFQLIGARSGSFDVVSDQKTVWSIIVAEPRK